MAHRIKDDDPDRRPARNGVVIVNKTKIDWCTHTVNPVVGCTFGCEYCYARKMNDRFKWIDYWNKPQFYPDRLEKLNSKKPKIIFMNSMSDIADWEDEWKDEVFKAIKENPQHIYLFLSKRPKVYEKILPNHYLPQNVWFGATATSPDTCQSWDIHHSGKTFLSIEPIFESFEGKRFRGFDWVIVGAETGNRRNKVIPKRDWILDIKKQCNKSGIPIFMKESLRELMGQDFVQEFPWERGCN